MSLVSGCCSGQNALPPGPVTGAVDGSVTFVTTVPSTEQELDSILWGFTKGSESEITVFNSIDNSTGPGFEGRITVNRFTGSLELRVLTLSDTGKYTVNLRVNESTELTGQTTLDIYEKISGANIIGPTEVLIAGNNSAILSCEVASGTMISRKWLKDGQPLSPNNRTTFSGDNSTVTIGPVQRTDNGQYQCRLINPVSTDAASYNLTVNFGPVNVTIIGEGTAEGEQGSSAVEVFLPIKSGICDRLLVPQSSSPKFWFKNSPGGTVIVVVQSSSDPVHGWPSLRAKNPLSRPGLHLNPGTHSHSPFPTNLINIS
ncbi:hypothetical protein SKAU_G00223230 [Synaphobranchus kaupii]|uniref:Ig-like domain-containing protein n=1 Tax=Synaphobranchus kaupii TaxID=118154 RepID=A0A9Q1FBM8_SYNKA|nr:hypothetical protein SKAU_G00223230 [Synaphobranchus kaupii]